MATIQKLYGKSKPDEENSGEAEASTSASAAAVATPPPAKKAKEAPKRRYRKKHDYPETDRVTRTRRNCSTANS